MGYHDDHTPETPEEAKFYECLKNGDDFMKIEIYRLARYWYLKALETGIQTDLISQKLAVLEKASRFERKVIAILAVLAVFIVTGAVIGCNI
jgi:hypothetical protein